jgi:hypothetical protein
MCAARGISKRCCNPIYDFAKLPGSFDCSLPLRNRVRVSLWDATHWRRASALHTRFDAAAVSCDGLRSV